MVIGLDEIVGKEYCTRANGSITGTCWERSSDNKTTVWEATLQKKKYMYFLKFNFQSGYGSYGKLLTKYDTLPSCC